MVQGGNDFKRVGRIGRCAATRPMSFTIVYEGGNVIESKRKGGDAAGIGVMHFFVGQPSKAIGSAESLDSPFDGQAGNGRSYNGSEGDGVSGDEGMTSADGRR